MAAWTPQLKITKQEPPQSFSLSSSLDVLTSEAAGQGPIASLRLHRRFRQGLGDQSLGMVGSGRMLSKSAKVATSSRI